MKLNKKHKRGEMGLYIDEKFILSSKALEKELFDFAVANGASADSIQIIFRSAW